MSHKRLIVLALLLGPPAGFAGDAPRPAGAYETAYTVASPLATRDAVARRLLHGYQYRRVTALAASRGDDLSSLAFDPAAERWQVYAPPRCAAGEACGALVWIHPWNDASLPRDWARVLDARALVYVSARRSGNEEDVVDRRVPLALLGLAGVQASYRIDPDRTYVGGFSGGGRTASRIATGYADVFSGGMFVATSDGVGTSEVPLPGGAALDALLTKNRYAFIVGTEDPANADYTRRAHRQYRESCVLDAELFTVSGWHHRNVDGRWLARLIDALDRGHRAPATDTAACRARLEAAGGAEIDAARERLAAGDREGARERALDAHRRYGGLIAAAFEALIAELEPGR